MEDIPLAASDSPFRTFWRDFRSVKAYGLVVACVAVWVCFWHQNGPHILDLVRWLLCRLEP